MEYILKTERETLKFRLLALVVVAFLLYWQRPSWEQLWPPVFLILGYFLYILLLSNFLLPRITFRGIVYAMIAVDASALSYGLNLAGGVSSALIILFPIFILYYSIFFGYTSSLFSAVVFSLYYVLLATLGGEVRTAGEVIAFQVPFFFLIAIFSGYLSQRRIEERRVKDELQEYIRVQSQAREMLEVAQTLGRTWEVDGVLQEAIGTFPRLLGVSRCLIALWDEGGGRLVAKIASLDLSQLGLRSSEELVSSEGKPLAVEGTKPQVIAQSALPSWATEHGVKYLLAVHLISRERKIGMAYLFNEGEERSFQESELRLAQGYGEFLADALANALFHQSAQTKVSQLVKELEGTIQRMERVGGPRAKKDITVGELRLDVAKEQAWLKGKPLSLSPIEFHLLYVLAENAGRPLNQETLLRLVWGEDYRGVGNVVDVSIHRLRRKLEDSSGERCILTVRGLGYMFSPGKPGATS